MKMFRMEKTQAYTYREIIKSSAEDVFFPVNGEVIETNEELDKKPELVNSDCYTNWLVKIKCIFTFIAGIR